MNANSRIFQKHKAILGGLLLGMLAGQPLLADDVEVYLYEQPDPVPPNVLFVLDESGSMAWDIDGNRIDRRHPGVSRRDMLVDAMLEIFNQPSMNNINAAMMGYTTASSYYTLVEMLRAHTGDFQVVGDNKTEFLTGIDGLETVSYTPTVKALEQAVAWYRRDQTFVDYYGHAMTSPIAGEPANNWCRTNHIVLLSDGEPNSNTMTQYEGITCSSDSISQGDNGRCAREIAAWAFNTDLEPSADWFNTQNIVTHTIAFGTSTGAEAFLESISNAGGGGFYYASDASDLVAAFQSILTEAQESIPYAYTAPVIPFNQDNAAVSGDRIYVPLFVPSVSKAWKGNLKSYTITTKTNADGSDVLVLRDRYGDPVVDDNYEFVDSCDHWGIGMDHGDPLVGGVAAHMGENGAIRNLYTNIDSTTALSNSVNRVSADNTGITNEMMNVVADADRTDLIDWVTWNWVAPTPAAGEDPEESHEGVMGASIHTQPVVVDYGSNRVIYLPTSEGVLEAIDANTGKELWAFMPRELLPNIGAIKDNNSATIPYYGLDGPLTVYETGNRTMAIVGMRRGGKSYYLLDITNRLNPIFVKEITDPNPGVGGDDFDGLGQTWSKPYLTRVHLPSMSTGTTMDVLVFGGGYDTDQDTATTRVNDDEGNAIFIVKASNGELVKRLANGVSGIADMNNAIPADVVPFDMNRNGILDRLYAADVGGRVIRIDLSEEDVSLVTGGVIADINEGTSEFRRFFNTPEIGYYSKSGVQYLTVMIGTGNRSNPLDASVLDRFYVIKDPTVWGAPATYQVVMENDLYDASDNLVQDGNVHQQATARNDLLGASGWYIDFQSSEKSFSQALLYDYAVFFTTFSAQRDADLSACEARGATGTSRFYAVNMMTGAAQFAGLGGDADVLNKADRSRVLNTHGMPPAPNLVFPGGENGMIGETVKVMVGFEEVVDFPLRLIPIWWEEVFGQGN